MDRINTHAHREPEKASNRHINRFKMAHMVGVAEYMRERADDYGLDPDTMYVTGLMHDIGYLEGRREHERIGAVILESAGLYNKDILLAVKYHGGKLIDVEESAKNIGANMATLVLTVEADLSVDAEGYRTGFEGRLSDIISRYGEDHIATETVKENQDYIWTYCRSRDIPTPEEFMEKNAMDKKADGKRREHAGKRKVQRDRNRKSKEKEQKKRGFNR